jgi:hypothetical protein
MDRPPRGCAHFPGPAPVRRAAEKKKKTLSEFFDSSRSICRIDW